MKLAEMAWPAVQEAAPRTVALLPIAAIEQHGPHMAVSTDTALVTAVAERAEALLPRDIVLCPTLAFGSSHHHLKFPGTMSIGHDTYVQVLVDLLDSLVQSGFTHILALNGHGGNITPGKQALAILSDRHDDSYRPNIAFGCYWEIGGSAFAGDPPMESPAVSHACEYETSMMLALYPSRVAMEAVVPQNRPPRNGYIGWEDDEPYRGVTMSKRTHFVSSNGASGAPHLATAVKGEHLIDTAVTALVAFLTDFKTWPQMPDLRETKGNS